MREKYRRLQWMKRTPHCYLFRSLSYLLSEGIIVFYSFFFFFQAEDGIRDTSVTGVQTCALPIFRSVIVEERLLLAIEIPIIRPRIDSPLVEKICAHFWNDQQLLVVRKADVTLVK